MTLHRALATGSALALGLLVALTGPAAADTARIPDPRYDAGTVVDITSVVVDNTTQSLVVHVDAPDFVATPLGSTETPLAAWLLLTVGLEFKGKPSADYPADWNIDLFRAEGGEPVRAGLFYEGEDDDIEVPCPGLTSRVEPGVLELTVPQSCFGDRAGTVRARAFIRTETDFPGLLVRPGYGYTFTPQDDDTKLTGWIKRG